LLDEDGNKRYIKGPAVVFPKPTEAFVEKNGSRKFKAIELNEISGLYIKVIAPYEENGQSYKVGDELFITGRDQMIYFPRPEHAVIRYGEREVHHAVAIPAGEARYVLNRLTGQITLKKGPAMFLPDPRKEVIVRRVLDPKSVALWFPGNQEALEYNRRLMSLTRQKKGEEFVQDREARELLGVAEAGRAAAPAETVPEGFVGDEFTRRQQFSPPRTITLDTKYEGAVAINVWTGYAVLVVSRVGKRKVIVGPGAHLLEYFETLEPVELSTGTPKTDEQTMKTVYLRVLHTRSQTPLMLKRRICARSTSICHTGLILRVTLKNGSMWRTMSSFCATICARSCATSSSSTELRIFMPTPPGSSAMPSWGRLKKSGGGRAGSLTRTVCASMMWRFWISSLAMTPSPIS
jgi:major vault protein